MDVSFVSIALAFRRHAAIFLFFPRLFTCFEWDPLFDERRGLTATGYFPLYWGVILLAVTLTHSPVSVFKLNGINIAGEEVVTTYYKKLFLHPLSGTDVNN
jgi:hypothetical protein